MENSLYSLTHGSNGLALAYVVALVPMEAALLRTRAGVGKMLLSPLLAVPVMLVAAIIVAIVHPLLGGFGPVLQTACGVAMVAAIAWFVGIWLARRTSMQDAFLHLRGAVVSRAGPRDSAAS